MLLALAGCHSPPKPKIALPNLPLPPPAAPVAPPLPVPAPIPTVWSFAVGSAGCAALAAGEAGGFGITVQSDGAVDFSVSGAGGTSLPLAVGVPVAIRFGGPAGSWKLSGMVGKGVSIRAHVGAGNEALGMVLAVLGGGTARAGDYALGLPALEIPPAGAAGSAWFTCARNREHG